MAKPKRNRIKAAGTAGAAPQPVAPVEPAAARRRWLVRLAGLVLLPLLVLGVAEGGLRLAGYGYLTTFFKPIRVGNRDCLVENDKFGLRFFPPELARSPPPVVMEAKKPPGVRRVFLLGESAALGDPRPGYGAGRYLQVLLEERFPGTKFEVICVAVTAINSHAVLPIARECARHEGDLWIVYMGNNEMVGPFGACTVFGSQAPPLWRVRLALAIQQTRVGQWLMVLGRKLGGAPGHGGSWGGMKMFMENQIAPGDPRKEVVYRSFRRNLADLVQAGRAAGVPVLLSTVAVNLKDCPPFASFQRPSLPEAARQACARLSAEALAAEKTGDFSRAAGIYDAAAELDPGFAEFHFRRGLCLLAQADRDRAPVAPPSAPSGKGTNPVGTALLASARVSFERARDADALPFRADSRINAIIREVAAASAGPGLELCDAVALLATNSPVGIPGREAFYEHVHFNFDGNYLLARAWAQAVGRLLPLEAPGAPPGNWASQALCERRLALTDWNRYAVLEDVLQRLASPPFTEQIQHSLQVETVRGQLQEVGRRLTRSAAEEARQNVTGSAAAGAAGSPSARKRGPASGRNRRPARRRR